ncbi:MAG: hypothetical protein AAF266_14040 [Planctomycetota bacterium]
MNATRLREIERSSRQVACWGSLAAAVLWAGCWVVDSAWSAPQSIDLAVYSVATVALFVGYAVAWRRRWEASGSFIAVAAIAVAYFTMSVGPWWTPPHPAMLLVALPAVLHLVAVALHRAAVTARRKQSYPAGHA